ncbi:hypothetical protein HCU40_24230 [Pseudanabaena biceps]|nr:hypothetical protein [Pseudanabaena biceps]
MKFYNALMEADGIELESKVAAKGDVVLVIVSVFKKNGNLLIGSAYTQLMGLKAGDELEIRLGRKHIHLRQVGADDEE